MVDARDGGSRGVDAGGDDDLVEAARGRRFAVARVPSRTSTPSARAGAK
jgi:hypothetical protein